MSTWLRNLTLGACAIAGGMGLGSQAKQTSSIVLVVTDLATNSPVPAATVRVVDSTAAGAVIARGTTDANGRFIAQISDRPRVVVEFEKITYVRRPERVPVSVREGRIEVKGHLLKADATAAYYQQAAAQVDEIASTADNDEARRSFYVNAWSRVEALSADERRIFASGLSSMGRAALSSQSSFLAALRSPEATKRFASGAFQYSRWTATRWSYAIRPARAKSRYRLISS